jgi:hypothetical protein
MWAKINSSSERTTNSCESFYKYNLLFYIHHPIIYTFLEIFKKNSNRHQKSNLNGHTTRKPKKPTSNKMLFIEDNINEFQNNKISRLEKVRSD